ncbi:MAG: HPr family phosphocarrier protein [Acidobacteriota bacterium]
MQSRFVTIQNRLGLHARAAAKLVRLAATFQSEIQVARTDARSQQADAKSILGLLLLAATQGTEIEVSAQGEDEEAAVDALCKLIDDHLGEY